MTTYSDLKQRLGRRGNVPSDRRVVWSMCGGRCFWCDRTIFMHASPDDPRSLTVDHINERSSGLSRSIAKVAACKRCNTDRSDTPAETYWALWALRLSLSARPPIDLAIKKEPEARGV